MVRLGQIGGFIVSFAMATGVLSAGADARDIRIVRQAKTVASPVTPAVPVVRDVTPKAQPVKALSSASVGETPTCARKVKMVYAGYGEAERVSCTLASADSVSMSGLRTETH